MPDKSTKHIPKHQAPVGAVKDRKVKVFDGDSQTVKWRQGSTGMSRDWDGDPTSKNYNRADSKERPLRTHRGRRPKAPRDGGAT